MGRFCAPCVPIGCFVSVPERRRKPRACGHQISTTPMNSPRLSHKIDVKEESEQEAGHLNGSFKPQPARTTPLPPTPHNSSIPNIPNHASHPPLAPTAHSPAHRCHQPRRGLLNLGCRATTEGSQGPLAASRSLSTNFLIHVKPCPVLGKFDVPGWHMLVGAK